VLPPRILILSEGNEVYDINSISLPLNFTINKPVSYIGYSIDGNPLTTLTDYTILPQYSYGQNSYIPTTDNRILLGLLEGSHTLTLYANNTARNTGESEALHFTIVQEAQLVNPELFPTTWAAAAVTATAIGAIIVAAYYTKSRRTNQKNP
jgi:hypothetical protein